MHQNPQATWNPPASSRTDLRLQVKCSGHTLQAPNNCPGGTCRQWSGEHPSVFSTSGGLPAMACMGRLIFLGDFGLQLASVKSAQRRPQAVRHPRLPEPLHEVPSASLSGFMLPVELQQPSPEQPEASTASFRRFLVLETRCLSSAQRFLCSAPMPPFQRLNCDPAVGQSHVIIQRPEHNNSMP
jgi:hypothetical protein